MNTFDVIVLVIFGFCLIRGIFRGLIKEVSAIIGVLGGLFGAALYYPLAARPIAGWFSNPFYADIISFLVIFCVVFILVSVLGIVIKYLLNIAFLGWLDRLCGAGFGAVKGLLIASVLLLALTAFLPRGTTVVGKSLLAPYINVVSENLAKIAASDLKQKFIVKIGDLKKIWGRR